MDDMSSHGVQRVNTLRIFAEFLASFIEHIRETVEEVVGILVWEVGVGHYDIQYHILILEHVP